jgi:murein DD-endopeptidase MepM/ murein hydrolase activator NlpD
MARTLRVLGLVLALTGCAVESPRPVPVALAPPPPTLMPPPIISRFGDWQGAEGVPRLWQHSGIDIRAAIGTPVLAAADGTVLRVGRQSLAGKLIAVGHADDLATVYYHLSEIRVVPGQTVRRGEVIGLAGNTGNATTPHLHFGVCHRSGGLCGDRIDAGWRDPLPYWIDANPCFVPGRALPSGPVRLSYPIPCA